MDITTILFYVFSGILLVSSFRVITARSTVHAALFLILSFFTASCIWMLLKAEFLAIALVLVYVGAVMVLFLFVVMMLDINLDTIRQGFKRVAVPASVIGVVIALEMSLVLFSGFHLTDAKPFAPEVAKVANTKALGIDLYTNYLFPVQIAAVILLVAIIAAIALTLRRRKDSHYQNPAEQVKATKADRLRVVKVDAVVEKPAAPMDSNPANPAGGQA